MLPLPWWILGTVPNDDESIAELGDQEVVSTPKSHEPIAVTPVSMFRTPSASPCIDMTDKLPKMVNYSSFLKGAKRRSSFALESESPKSRKTASRRSAGSEQLRTFERKETEIMNKNEDGFPVIDANETFNILEADFPRADSPLLQNKSDESLADKDILNHTVNLIDDENEHGDAADFPSREYPMFFTSFNDTTVLFNTTITGDIDDELYQRNAAVGDWVFKGNKFLENSNEGESSESPVFKEPISKPRNTREKKRDTSVSARSDVSKSSRRKRDTKKEAPETPPSTKQVVPQMGRRRTPSRKAKTYKSMKEI